MNVFNSKLKTQNSKLKTQNSKLKLKRIHYLNSHFSAKLASNDIQNNEIRSVLIKKYKRQ